MTVIALTRRDDVSSGTQRAAVMPFDRRDGAAARAVGAAPRGGPAGGEAHGEKKERKRFHPCIQPRPGRGFQVLRRFGRDILQETAIAAEPEKMARELQGKAAEKASEAAGAIVEAARKTKEALRKEDYLNRRSKNCRISSQDALSAASL